jgi:hypothetical protein
MPLYQITGLDANGTVTHSSPRSFKRLTIYALVKYQAEWEEWRLSFLRENPGEFPLRHTQPTVAMVAYRFGEPHRARRFILEFVKHPDSKKTRRAQMQDRRELREFRHRAFCYDCDGREA